MNYIQGNLFNNSKKVIDRNSRIIYYDYTNYFFKIDEDDELPLSCNIYLGNKNEQETLLLEENKWDCQYIDLNIYLS